LIRMPLGVYGVMITFTVTDNQCKRAADKGTNKHRQVGRKEGRKERKEKKEED